MDINLDEILEKHQRWLNKSPGWSEKDRAVLCRADLSFMDLSGINLYGADVSSANFLGSNLTGANFTGADMTSTILSHANLTRASLKRATLLNANMFRADVTHADMYGANLFEANLSEVNVTDARNFPQIAFACPGTGSFTGWKKAIRADGEQVIVELEIPADALRSSATGRKCRCNTAAVVSIKSMDGETSYTTAKGWHDDTFVYTVGQTVTVADWDTDRWNECSRGIHFYMTRQEAVDFV